MKRNINVLVSSLITIGISLAFVAAASGQGTVIVTPSSTQGWSEAETGNGGDISFVVDNTPPGDGVGALRLTTDGSGVARAQYQHETATMLVNITQLSYWTKQVSGPAGVAAPAFQLETCLIGAAPDTCSGYTTLNFEPYQNPSQGPVVANEWQDWDVDAGLFWSSRTVQCQNGTITGGSGGSGGLYTLEQLKTACPNAAVFNHYVNVGTGAAGAWDVYTDLVNFNGTIYDFEPFLAPRNADQCKNNGWRTLRRSETRGFRNQGDCIQWVNTGK
jgi:hypothetical protein